MSLRRGSTRAALRSPIRWGSAPKPGGGTRTLARLSTDDERRFAGAVAQIVPFVERARGREAVANRVSRYDPSHGITSLEPWPRARERWERELGQMERTARVIAITDVRECYASIGPTVVQDRLASLGAPPESGSEVGCWLRVFGEAGVAGLPVGPEASAVLADAVLFAGDAALRAVGVVHLRWVDDVVIAAPDRRGALQALDRLRQAWAAVGLEVHDGKTLLLGRDGFGALHARPKSPVGAASLR